MENFGYTSPELTIWIFETVNMAPNYISICISAKIVSKKRQN